MPMEDTYGIQSRIGSIIVVERWYCCRGSPVFSDRNIQYKFMGVIFYISFCLLQAGKRFSVQICQSDLRVMVRK